MRHFYLVMGLAEKVNKAAVCSVKLFCFAWCTKIAIKFLLSRFNCLFDWTMLSLFSKKGK